MGLLKTAARTAVITSTASRTHNRVQRRQQGAWAAQQAAAPPVAAPPPPAPPVAAPPPAAPTAPSPSSDVMAGRIAQLRELGELRAAGVLTDAEFEAQKAVVLAS